MHAGDCSKRAEKDPLAGQGAAEDRPVHPAVEDEEQDVPAGVGEERVELGQHAVEELADRLAAEEARLEGHDASECGRHELLHGLGRDAPQLSALDLAQRVPLFRLDAGRDDPRGLERPREAARDHAVERDAGERVRCGGGLEAAVLGEHDLLRVDPVEVAHLCVPHQVDAAACDHCARSERPPADCMPAIIPGARNAVGEAGDELAEQRVGIPFLVALEQLACAPADERVDRAAPDVEHLAGDRLRLVRAQRDDRAATCWLGRAGRSPPPARPCRMSPRSCACARSGRCS